jgi:hypothetical protein
MSHTQDDPHSHSHAPRPNVELVRGVYEAFATKDIPRIVSLFASDIDLSQSMEVPGAANTRATMARFSSL